MAGEYDSAGKLVNSEILTSTVGRAADGLDAEVAAVCAAYAPSGLRVAQGYKAAQRDVQSPPDNLIAQANAAPSDPDLAAWVCAAGARGRWNPSLPKQCDHAVALNPASAAVIVDRGFLKLVLGKNPAADADFQKAVEIDPASAGGLFGHSLVMSMRGDLAAARKVRDRALDLDPKVADWIEQTYRFQITDPRPLAILQRDDGDRRRRRQQEHELRQHRADDPAGRQPDDGASEASPRWCGRP